MYTLTALSRFIRNLLLLAWNSLADVKVKIWKFKIRLPKSKIQDPRSKIQVCDVTQTLKNMWKNYYYYYFVFGRKNCLMEQLYATIFIRNVLLLIRTLFVDFNVKLGEFKIRLSKSKYITWCNPKHVEEFFIWLLVFVLPL